MSSSKRHFVCTTRNSTHISCIAEPTWNILFLSNECPFKEAPSDRTLIYIHSSLSQHYQPTHAQILSLFNLYCIYDFSFLTSLAINHKKKLKTNTPYYTLHATYCILPKTPFTRCRYEILPA